MADPSITDQPAPAQPAPTAPPVPEPVLRKPERKWVLSLLLTGSHVGALLLGALIGWALTAHGTDRQGARPTGQRFDSLAILPFTGDWSNRPIDGGDDWPEKSRHFLTVRLPDDLSRNIVDTVPAGSLKVIAPQAVRDRMAPALTALENGRALKVAVVLSGKVSPGGELTLQLIDVESAELLWSNTYSLIGVGGSPRWVNANYESEIVRAVINKLTGRKKG
jgi:hypothetical protein